MKAMNFAEHILSVADRCKYRHPSHVNVVRASWSVYVQGLCAVVTQQAVSPGRFYACTLCTNVRGSFRVVLNLRPAPLFTLRMRLESSSLP